MGRSAMPGGGNSGLQGGRIAPGPLLSPALGVELCAGYQDVEKWFRSQAWCIPPASPSPSLPPLCATETPPVICSKHPSLPACALDKD